MTYERPSNVPALLCAAFMVVLMALPVAGQESGEPLPAEAAAQATLEPLEAPGTLDRSLEDSEAMAAERHALVSTYIDPVVTADSVVEAMRAVPRHAFIPTEYLSFAYQDFPLPIGYGQTISQPSLVAMMTQLLEIEEGDRVLEIGTGSGFQAAVLAEICSEVYTIEIIESLATQAAKLLEELDYKNIHVKAGDGYQGWPAHAPFDVIIVTAAPDHVPRPLVEQLKVGGRMILPVGTWFQQLRVITKTKDGVVHDDVLPVTFVPMTGEAQQR